MAESVSKPNEGSCRLVSFGYEHVMSVNDQREPLSRSHLSEADASDRLVDDDLAQAQALMLAALETLDRLEIFGAAALLSQAISATGAAAPLPKKI